MRKVLAGLFYAGLLAGYYAGSIPGASAQTKIVGVHADAASAMEARWTSEGMSSSAWQQDQSLPSYRPKSKSKGRSSQASPSASVSSTMDEVLPQYGPVDNVIDSSYLGSTYIPVDSWIYPALMRLYSLGYLNKAFVDMRPWTRISVLRMLAAEQERIHMERHNEEALEIFNAVLQELQPDVQEAGGWKLHATLESTYERAMGIAGTPLNDSYHLGQTIINDYGRPYEQGFNDYTGFSARAHSGPFALYVRGEYQHAPGATGYSAALAQTLAAIDAVPPGPQETIPQGPIPQQNFFRLIEANLSATLWNYDISIGKSDVWDGPAMGGAFDWSNNAQNIYSFRINRIEPFHIPLLSDVMGPVRYEFLVGALQGHTYPLNPWVHMEKFAFNPSANFEYGFSRTVIWGGVGHEPVTLGTFWTSFASFQNVTPATKNSPNDPGARFSTFDYTYRVPFLRRWLTQYTDSESHDDVTPVSAPRRAGIRTGLYLTHFPGAPKFDLRAEAVYTNLSVSPSVGGTFMYYETVQRQGYTNQGNIFGDWIGRESTGGQAWLTYHLSTNEMVQLSYRNAKAAKDFIPGGTTQNLFTANVVKRIRPQVELNAWLQYERWKAPVYKPGGQNDVTTNVQITWYPEIKRTLRKW
ncbi:MAG: capsule assembly Wzi family protein [Acidobacteriaceae bacterium]